MAEENKSPGIWIGEGVFEGPRPDRTLYFNGDPLPAGLETDVINRLIKNRQVGSHPVTVIEHVVTDQDVDPGQNGQVQGDQGVLDQSTAGIDPAPATTTTSKKAAAAQAAAAKAE
jgi:hypothetical protein